MLVVPILRQRSRRPSKVSPSAIEEPLGLADVDKPGASRPKLLSFEELPEWHQDNVFVRHGYRAISDSVYACLASWSYMHNETINIYTHLVPAAVLCVAVSMLWAYFQFVYPEATLADRAIFAFFFLSATICLSVSAGYHTLMNHSCRVSHLWLQIDFLGIIILTLGKFISGVYMAFYCSPGLQKIYWTMICTLGTTTMFIVINPRFQGRRWRTLRAWAFILTGLSGFIPVIHGILQIGLARSVRESGLGHYLLEGVLLMIGAFFYATRMPESLRPGRFDIYFSSHQIFHVLVVLAAVVHLIGISSAYDFHYANDVCSVDFI